MRRGTAALALAAGVLAAAPAEAADCERRPLLFTNVTVATGDVVTSGQDVVAFGGRVLSVGPSGTVTRPTGAEVVDGAGHTLLPGLVDAHAHLFELGGPNDESLFERPEQALPVTARQLLSSGVTSARLHLHDLEAVPAFARRSADDCFAAPRLQWSGPGFIGGHRGAPGRQVWGLRDAADAPAKVAAIRAAGGRWIALHELDRFAAGEAEALVHAARATGLRVMADGSTAAAAERAIALGVDTIEYMDRTAEPRYPADLLARLQGGSIILVPPIGYYHRYAAWRDDPAVADVAPLRGLVPEAVLARLRAGLEEARRKPPPAWAATGDRFATLPVKFRQLRDAGLDLAVGTDVGSTSMLHHDAIWWELDTWRRLGVPPLAAVRAATVAGARVLADPEIGRIAPGMRADLVLYRGDVREGPLTADRVRMVVKGGVVFVRNGLWVASH